MPLKGLHASPFSTALTLYIIVRFLNRYFISFFIREFYELVTKNASFCNYLIKSYSINFLSFIDFIRVFEKPSSSNGWRIVDDYNSIYYIIVWRRSINSNSVVTSIESENFGNFSEKSSRTILLYIYNIFLNGRFFCGGCRTSRTNVKSFRQVEPRFLFKFENNLHRKYGLVVQRLNYSLADLPL